MTRPRLMISWIGAADLRSHEYPSDDRGPIRTLLSVESFDQVHLLSSYPSERSFQFAQSLGCGAKLHMEELGDPTDYLKIFELVNTRLKAITGLAEAQQSELCIHLSSGTPAMTAVWVLLGQSRYPARFFQTYGGPQKREPPVREEVIPFDLAVDYVTEVMEGADRRLQTLVSERPKEYKAFEDVLGHSESLYQAMKHARKAALRNVPVLLTGESGTGKEMFAQAIHRGSTRRSKPFVAVNCAALTDSLLESELFGHVKGAFTGAVANRKGAFEQAHKGTLFLDEVGECSPSMQAKLLRVLQPLPKASPSSRVIRRVGDSKDITVDVRIISATLRDLVEEVSARRFREDLYYRLSVVPIELPPLRVRVGDVELLAQSFLTQINERFGLERGYLPRRLSPMALRALKGYDWPGNVRQLYYEIMRACILSEGAVIQASDLPSVGTAVRGPESMLDQPLGEDFQLKDVLDGVRKHYIERALSQAEGNKSRAARLLGLNSYQVLSNQMKRLGLKADHGSAQG